MCFLLARRQEPSEILLNLAIDIGFLLLDWLGKRTVLAHSLQQVLSLRNPRLVDHLFSLAHQEVLEDLLARLRLLVSHVLQNLLQLVQLLPLWTRAGTPHGLFPV